MSGYKENKANYAEVKKAITGHWLRLFEALAPELAPAMEKHPRHVGCPMHGGKDGFRLYRDVDTTGGGVCNTCGTFHDGFELLAWVKGWSKSEVLDVVAKVEGFRVAVKHLGVTLGGSKATSKPIANVEVGKYNDRALKALKRVFNGTVSADHPTAQPLRDYLEGRGLGLLEKIPSSLRFHPCLGYWEADSNGQLVKVGEYPAMLSLVSSQKGDAVTYHRTYLTRGGQKAPVACPKKLMTSHRIGALKGAAIRLSKCHDELAITEGVETALAVYLSTGRPTWAAVSAGGLEAVKLPPTVRKVWIMADLDRSRRGEQSAKVLADRLSGEGREVRICLPSGAIPSDKKSVDWLDVFNQAGGRS